MKGVMSLWWMFREHLGMQGHEGGHEPMAGGRGASWNAGE